MLSDALESIINVVASAFALISVLVAARPPDHWNAGIRIFDIKWNRQRTATGYQLRSLA
ncbi:MAG: hypothetical protein JRK53_10395 [Deltaproteobacteria bacterium]|nr:hypothetical protein [Deltaproteobacteria bacterium]MBW1897094.1 hypothetical protein [Deltaproteobacteria bacterium]